MSATIALRFGLVAAALALFCVFYSIGAASTGWGRLLAAFGVAVLLAAGLAPKIAKPAKFVVATFLLLVGLLPFGLGSLDWETFLLFVLVCAAFAAFIVVICPHSL